jgi:glycosyltransferase involved in cell wall biosynthesis
MAARVAGALQQGKRDLPSALPFGISVIVPSFQGRDYILHCLSSLDEQTLDKALYEVIVVLNGPEDGTRAKIEAFRAQHPDLRLRVMHSTPGGASLARNIGIDAAHFGFLCFVDDDDRIGPAYLATLLDCSDSSSIAFADIVDIVDGSETPSPISRQLAEAAKIERPTVTNVHAAATMNAVKSVPTWMARAIQFDTDLKSGEDVVFWCALIAQFRPGVTLAPASSGARYYRYVRQGSLSRRHGYDFEVNERVDVIAALDRLRGQDSEGLSETKSLIQAGFIIRYLRQRPEDFARFATDHFHRVPPKVYAHIMKSLTRRLVIAYCFPPDMDTSAIVMAKRLRTDARPVEVLCNDMGDRRSKDPRLRALVAPYVAGVHDLGAPVSFGSWDAISAFADKARTAFDRLDALRRYEDLYSRAMWPASHFAAAALKAVKPSLDWIAEFSDPLRLDIDGKQREGKLDLGWLSETGLRTKLEQAGFPVPRNDNLFFWAEYLPFCLADKIIFTNALQKAYMLDQPYPAAALARVERVSEISPHPQPDPGLFRQGHTPTPLSKQKVNIGYFGNFYHNRNLNLLIEVLSGMDTAVRDRIRLHVFCNSPDMIGQSARAAGIEEAVTGSPMLPYLDFLSQIRLFDYLLVTDTETQGRKSVNPYLPSKVSDYLGAGRAIWALYEPGSTLAGLKLPAGSLRTPLGDKEGYADALTRMSAQAR